MALPSAPLGPLLPRRVWALRFRRGRPPEAHPVFRHDETSRASWRCLTHHLHESALLPIPSVRVRKHGSLISSTERPCPQAFWKADVLCWLLRTSVQKKRRDLCQDYRPPLLPCHHKETRVQKIEYQQASAQ